MYAALLGKRGRRSIANNTNEATNNDHRRKAAEGYRQWPRLSVHSCRNKRKRGPQQAAEQQKGFKFGAIDSVSPSRPSPLIERMRLINLAAQFRNGLRHQIRLLGVMEMSRKLHKAATAQRAGSDEDHG